MTGRVGGDALVGPVCPNCHVVLEAGWRERCCPYCGTALGPQDRGQQLRELANNRWLVLGLLFGALAAFGLPLLWMSERFSRRQKFFWSVAVVLYTALLVGITAWICWWAWQRVASTW